MKIQKLIDLLDGKILVGEKLLDEIVTHATSSDLMSDVLAFSKDQCALLTGLCNSQVIRTCEMMDIHCIILVRGKAPTQDMLNLSEDRNIALIVTDMNMFDACGLLYENGLRGGADQ